MAESATTNDDKPVVTVVDGEEFVEVWNKVTGLKAPHPVPRSHLELISDYSLTPLQKAADAAAVAIAEPRSATPTSGRPAAPTPIKEN